MKMRKPISIPDVAVSGLETIKGVVSHKKKPGSRKAVKYFVAQSAG